jgi:hypothetical protein
MRRGNGRVSYEVEILKSQSSSFTIFREGAKIILKGQVDSDMTRKHLGETASINGWAVNNQLNVTNEVAPFPSIVAAIAAIPLLLSSTTETRLEVDPEKVVVSGILANPEIKQTVMSLFSSDKWGGAMIVDQLKPPIPPVSPIQPALPIPPSFSWKQEGPDRIVLAGSLPSQEVHDLLLQSVQKLAGPNFTLVLCRKND